MAEDRDRYFRKKIFESIKLIRGMLLPCSLLLLAACHTLSSKKASTPEKVGVTTLALYDASRSRPLVTEVWYPVEKNAPATSVRGFWVRSLEARNAEIKDSSQGYPLIIISHGNGGDRLNHAWLAEILSANGYVVAAIDHFGNTWNNKVPEAFIKIWDRPQDISFVIDAVEEKFKPFICHGKVGFIGYSLGGLTGIWIAGGKISDFSKLDLEKLRVNRYTRQILTPELIDSIDLSPAKASYRDQRVTAMFLIAPALGYFFDPESLASITVPIEIVASRADTIAGTTPQLLAEKINQASLTFIKEEATHYVFLNQATSGGKLILDQTLWKDPPEVDRAQVHQKVGEAALHFFDQHFYP